MERTGQQKSFLSLSVTSAAQNARFTVAPDPSAPAAASAPAAPPAPGWQPDFHRVAYTEWGNPLSNHTIICVHGFARNARDFDFLAERLSRRARVICPDIVGRGRSDWLRDASPAGDFGYNYAQYLHDLTALIAKIDVQEVDWIGTSLGGLLGMMVAAAPNSPVRRLVMNDVGPQIPGPFLQSLPGYLGNEVIFDSPDGLREFLQTQYSGTARFGELTEAQLRHMTKYSERKLPDGKVGLAFDHETLRLAKWVLDHPDPNTPNPFRDLSCWEVWARVRCPVLVLRGVNSAVLLQETLTRMQHEGPRAAAVTIPHCGHAPALMSDEQVTLVDTWLTT